jgi:hypothetical protein
LVYIFCRDSPVLDPKMLAGDPVQVGAPNGFTALGVLLDPKATPSLHEKPSGVALESLFDAELHKKPVTCADPRENFLNYTVFIVLGETLAP